MPPIRQHTPTSPPIKYRQRSRRACAPCRKRKIKCDGDEPCAACVGYGYDCLYATAEQHKATSPNGSAPLKQAVNTSSIPVNGPQAPSAPSVPEAVVVTREEMPYVAIESIVQPAHGTLLHQSIKTRFTSSSSAVAFPASLGLSFNLQASPRLQSYGWNPGTRSESKFLPQRTICQLITLEDIRKYADKYFKEVNIYFGIVSESLFWSRTTDSWNPGSKHGTDFEALICGIVALGSYMSGDDGLRNESEVVEHWRVLLDLCTSHPPGLLSMKHVAAWTLRAIYLRSTTRPHLSWMASCNSIHIAEAVGLHRECTARRVLQEQPRVVSALEKDLRRRVFWVAFSLNQFLAAEYGRTRVNIDLVDVQLPDFPAGDLTAQTISILQSSPSCKVLSGTVSSLVTKLENAASLTVNSPFLGLLRADVCFAIFRLFRTANIALSSPQITSLLQVINVALDGVKFLRSIRQSWWNIVGTPFHCVCVLLAIDTMESLGMIPNALNTLKKTVEVYDSYIPNEALRTAVALVAGKRSKMEREMGSLDVGLGVVGDMSEQRDGNEDVGWDIGEDLGFLDSFDFGDLVGWDGEGLGYEAQEGVQ